MNWKSGSRKLKFGLATVAVAAFAVGSGHLAAAPADAAASDPALAELMTEGGSVYATYCSACHGAAGDGGTGPALAGSQVLTSIGTISSQVIDGGVRMPAFSQLSDRQIAAVATFIRNSWGNAFGPVTDEDIAGWR